MALPSSGSISLSQVNTELGLSSTAQISLNDSAVRTLFGKASGAIAMSDGYGKANNFALTISSNQTNANLRSLAVAAGWDQSTKVVATINSGVYIGSNTTGTPALTINGSFPGGVELVNNGFIVGMGGAGGRGGDIPFYNWDVAYTAGAAGSAGGGALSVSSAITITNNGTIGGGGGGGGGGGSFTYQSGYTVMGASGSGGGGGRSSAAANSSGGSSGTTSYGSVAAGNTGGAGTSSAAGSGGASVSSGTGTNGAGGNGGGWGAAGATGGTSSNPSGPYGGRAGGGGGSAGYAVSGNSNITWATTGTRLGSIS